VSLSETYNFVVSKYTSCQRQEYINCTEVIRQSQIIIVYTTIVHSAWRWFTQPKHVADDKLLIELCLELFVYSSINTFLLFSEFSIL